MDYTTIPRSLIYKDRNNLNDFGVKKPGTINHHLFSHMVRMTLLRTSNAEEIALQCFNNAYYICTLIQFDEYPYLHMDRYEAVLLKEKSPFVGDIYQASMAMVCILLGAYDDKWKKKDDILIESIYHWTSSNIWTGNLCHKSFEDIVNTCNAEGYHIPSDAFAPRDIVEVIENFPERKLWEYADYICERLALLKDPRKRMHGTDMAIARLKDYQRKLCKSTEYDPRKDRFKNSDYGLVGDFSYEENIRNTYKRSQEAIDYYNALYPNAENCHHEELTESALPASGNEALIAENNQLRDQLAQCKSQMKELETNNNELKAKLDEVLEPVENLTAEQKVRMEFALQLLQAAGVTDEVLKKRGNKQKVATLMSLLLDIRNNNSRGNTAQTCANYISDRRYYPREQNQQLLLKFNTLCLELGIRVKLDII